MTAGRPVAPLLPATRALLLAAAVLVLLAGTQLFVFTERTATHFAWTIANPLTAAFLGAAYWGSFVIELLAARQRYWANARIAVPTVFVFTVLTLGVTLGYLELFHLGGRFGAATQAVTWAWIAVYALVPVLLGAVAVMQWRVRGPDPPAGAPLPSWLAGLLGVQSSALLTVGLILLVSPVQGGRLWPWPLTPLTARAAGAWLLSLGLAGVHALWERELRRLRPAGWGYLTIGALELIALARYPDRVQWSQPETVVYVLFLVSVLLVGGAAVVAGRWRRAGSWPLPARP